jgi:hypothetical protein
MAASTSASLRISEERQHSSPPYHASAACATMWRRRPGPVPAPIPGCCCYEEQGPAIPPTLPLAVAVTRGHAPQPGGGCCCLGPPPRPLPLRRRQRRRQQRPAAAAPAVIVAAAVAAPAAARRSGARTQPPPPPPSPAPAPGLGVSACHRPAAAPSPDHPARAPAAPAHLRAHSCHRSSTPRTHRNSNAQQRATTTTHGNRRFECMVRIMAAAQPIISSLGAR